MTTDARQDQSTIYDFTTPVATGGSPRTARRQEKADEEPADPSTRSMPGSLLNSRMASGNNGRNRLAKKKGFKRKKKVGAPHRRCPPMASSGGGGGVSGAAKGGY
jgi:hypothetical protein